MQQDEYDVVVVGR